MALTQNTLCNLALSLFGNDNIQITDFSADTGNSARQCRLHYEPTLHELVRMHTWNCTKDRVTPTETVPLITDSDDVEFTYNATENDKAQFSNSADDDRIMWNSTLERWERDDSYSAPFSAVYYDESTGNVPSETGWKKVSDDTDAGFTLSLDYDFGYYYAFLLPTNCLRPLYLTNSTTPYEYLKPRLDWDVEVRTILANVRPVYLLYIKEPSAAEMDSLFARAFYTLLASKLCVPLGYADRKKDLLVEFELVMAEARRVNSFEGQNMPVIDSDWMDATFTQAGVNNSWPPFSQSSYGTFPWA